MRTTKADVMRAVEKLATALGKRVSPNREKGTWHIDNNPIYGGIVIHEVIDDSGSVDCPFGYTRTPPKQFVEKVEFALRVLEYQKRRT